MKEIQILNNGDTLNAIRTKINENFQLTREELENGTNSYMNRDYSEYLFD